MAPKTAASTAAAAPKKADSGPSKPTYAVMVKKAIVDLKDRTGSSVPAISNYISSNFGGLNKAALVAALKKGVQDESLVKIKASYKLGGKAKAEPKPKKKMAPKPKAAPKKKAVAVAKPRKTIKKKSAAGGTTSTRKTTLKKMATPAKKKAAPKKKTSAATSAAAK